MSAKNFAVHKTAHTGITVESLEQALKFWQDLVGAEILYRRHIEMSPELNIIGIPDAVLYSAVLSLPDSSVIELLEYSTPGDRKTYKPRACDVGSVHVALEVEGSDALIKEASKIGWEAVDKPQKLQRGDGSVWTAIYMFGPNGEAVELLEKLGH